MNPLNLRHDFRYALRMAVKSPLFTTAVVLTLALSIGANTAIFSVVDAALLRPLPYPEPDRLARVATFFRSRGTEGFEQGQNGRTWEALRDHITKLDLAVLGSTARVNFSFDDRAELVLQERVSAGFFRVMGVQPLLGREFTPEEDRPGGPPVVLLSHGFWSRVFHSDPSVAGRTILLRGEPHSVVGIMPAGF